MKINPEKLVNVMKKRLETNASLAEKIGVNVATISHMRNGRGVRVSTMKKLVEALECNVEDLTDCENEEESKC